MYKLNLIMVTQLNVILFYVSDVIKNPGFFEGSCGYDKLQQTSMPSLPGRSGRMREIKYNCHLCRVLQLKFNSRLFILKPQLISYLLPMANCVTIRMPCPACPFHFNIIFLCVFSGSSLLPALLNCHPMRICNPLNSVMSFC